MANKGLGGTAYELIYCAAIHSGLTFIDELTKSYKMRFCGVCI